MASLVKPFLEKNRKNLQLFFGPLYLEVRRLAMTDISCTIPGMASKKEPKGRSPSYTLYARIDPDLGKAFEELRARNRRSIKAEIEVILEKHLEEQGLWARKRLKG